MLQSNSLDNKNRKDPVSGRQLTKAKLAQRGLIISVVILALFYFLNNLIPVSKYNIWTAIAIFTIYLATFLGLKIDWALNFAIFVLMIFLTNLIAETGSVNSTAMIWLCIILTATVLLQGWRAAVSWFFVMVAIGVLLMELAHRSVISARVAVDHPMVIWSLINYILAIGSLMLIIVFYDTSHRSRIQTLKERSESLSDMQLAITKAQAHKDDLIASVGHELRTPMNAILGLNEILKDELKNEHADIEIVNHIRQSTEQLLHIVDDVLDYSSVQAGRLKIQPQDFHLHQCIDAIFHRIKKKYEHLGIAFDIHLDEKLPAYVHGDPKRLQQIIRNLLDTFMGFSMEGRIQLECELRDGEIFFLITNQDINLSSAQFELAHSIINQHRATHNANNERKNLGDTGMGLTISAALIHLLKGRLGIKKRTGKGTEFCFYVPLPEVQWVETSAPLALNKQWIDLQILVVDDNAVNLLIVKKMIADLWPTALLHQVTTGQEGLDIIGKQAIDLILTDLMMPDMDGIGFTNAVRSLMAHNPVPIIALTASTNPIDEDMALQAGMNAVIHKPVDKTVLSQTIQYWLTMSEKKSLS
ncbi:MAG: response regulator [Betaproteobacteria bacterium]|nr:response regulator [Betaproteobacteria bacterium]NBY06992.1 response regulator [Betaproteobacteria bacterium]